MSRAPAGTPDGAFATLAREAVDTYERTGPVLKPVTAALLFLPGFAAATLMSAAAVPREDPVRLIAFLAVFVAGLIGQGTLALMCLPAGEGRPVRDLLGSATRAAGQLAIVSLVASAPLGLALLALRAGQPVLTLLLLGPGLYVFARLAAVGPLVLAEGLRAREALGRAWGLTQAQQRPILGFLALLLMVAAVVLMTGMLVALGLESAGVRAGVEVAGRFAGRAVVHWIEASASAALVVAQVAVYRSLTRRERARF